MKFARLSPSKITQLKDCSWSYYAKYELGVPDLDNDGSRRGTICHGLLECLVKEKHRDKLENILKLGSPFAEKCCARYLGNYASKLKLELDKEVLNLRKNGTTTHREIIDEMMMVGLRSDFKGGKDASKYFCTEILPEQTHILKVDDGNKKYEIKGVIDKTFLRKDKDGNVVAVDIVDYKTSASKYTAKTIDQNIQGLSYIFFAHKLYPHVKKITFKFLFLRFPDNPWMEVPDLSWSNLDGFEYYLTHIFDYLNTFNEIKAKSNMAKSNGCHFLCGKYGDKKCYGSADLSEKNWMCPMREPFLYWAVVDEKEEVVQTARERGDLKTEREDFIQPRTYQGCPAWNAGKDFSKFWNVLA